MKVIVDKIPSSIYDCIFFHASPYEAICELDKEVRESPCWKDNYCPYLMTIDMYLNRTYKENC
jgi:hypothetical protein